VIPAALLPGRGGDAAELIGITSLLEQLCGGDELLGFDLDQDLPSPRSNLRLAVLRPCRLQM
jgi:hypothetical protein